ncbi:MAG: NAD-dependent epimerase [Pseudonocardiales bacterium]|nr:MAG: NAD-dependent epimerase [Pseudonocardiales bacterium]
MRVVVIGATGNVGTSVVSALAGDPAVQEIVGVARRRPEWTSPKTEWTTADIRHHGLVEILRGADAVVHLAWLIQPSRDERELSSVNVGGTRLLLRAVADAGVPALVYASSVGAYSPGPGNERVPESWSTHGIGSSYYSRHKSEVERMLDGFEAEHPAIRVVRLRPGLIFKREAASEIRRYFAGPFLPGSLLKPGLLPVLPLPAGLAVQAVHTDDVAQAYRLAVTGTVRGAFNVASEPVLTGKEIASLLRARLVEVAPSVVRAGLRLSWLLRLQPISPGWLDMGLATPIMDTTRARDELGFSPRRSSGEALLEVLEGMRAGAGGPTPPLASDAGGPLRIREILTGVGRRA